MIWLLACGLGCLGVELALRLPIARTARGMGRDGREAGRIILSRDISDHWKERMALFYARRMGRQTLLMAACFALLMLVLVALTLALAQVAPRLAPFLASPTGLAVTLLASLLYVRAKQRLVRA